MVTTLLLVCGAMTMNWICDKITESGFGGTLSWWPYVLAVLGVFTIVTMWAVVVTEGCRKIKLQYYGFKLASAASLLGLRFWEHVRDILNPDTSLGAAPWVYYSIYAFLVFVFNIFDIANMPKEIADYLNKMGARIPKTKPGKATIEYLTKIQASTRFWGGILLSVLATTSTILDHNLRRINEGFSIGFTSVLIIVGSIIELRRSYQAYNVMPGLSKALRRYGL
ncbi:preprotein translocase subunit scy2 chloroplastic [Phtheirospermum japonicum]|uniref:Preprotein translocase subunit scy2 chloroplastic n=1 Tax=Phtheirospermum japonicum TaxID=374723 RepID=A0A830B533_9LAMI|nr:preprotein translocase subunit scy2 chloroplastic [Phtheirospermum japonicum]